MPKLPGGCLVFGPEEGSTERIGTLASRAVLTRALGAKYISQRINRYGPGRSPLVTNPSAEEVHYVVSGSGTCHLGGFDYALGPGTGVFVPPSAPFGVENRGSADLVTVAVCCPEESARQLDERPWPGPQTGGAPDLLVHEEGRREIPVRDRKFRLLVDTEFGCRQVTQFLGFIPPSQAPFHYHTYEEAIHILEGEGTVHVDGGSAPFGPGTNIFLPIGLHHCLENPGTGWVRLLGVFYPSGSPAAAYERSDN